MNTKPTEIKRLETEGIEIVWDDGEVHRISSKTLRKNCPSAVSKAERGDSSHDKPLGGGKALLKVVKSSVKEEFRLDKIWGVGNYALGMEWGDGHNTGIYTYSLLYDLGLAEKNEAAVEDAEQQVEDCG